MFDDYTTFDARIPFVPFTGVFHGFIFGTRKRFCSLIANLWLRTRRHTESSARGRMYVRAAELRGTEGASGFRVCTRTCVLLRRRVKNSVFWQTPKKKQLLKCERRARRRAAVRRRVCVFSRALEITQQIVLSKAMNIDRDAAAPTHTRTSYTHTRDTQGEHTRTWTYTQIHAVSARI